MRRREFIALVGGTVVEWPLAGNAQQPAKFARFGYLSFGTAAAAASRVEALRSGLRDLGHVEGTTIAIEYRFAETNDRLREFADELVASNVDILFAPSSTEVEAARRATRTIPIVFANHADPVGVGHVVSLARPGGNITGLSVQQTDFNRRGLSLIKEIAPDVTRIGILFDTIAPSHLLGLQTLEELSAKIGIRVYPAPVLAVADFEAAFAMLARNDVGAVIVLATSLTVRSRDAPRLLAELALKHRLPSMFGARDNVVAGGLMSYSANPLKLNRQAATYIDKILKGARPADLPVQQPTRFELVLNLKTAKALGLTIPPLLFTQADEMIE